MMSKRSFSHMWSMNKLTLDKLSEKVFETKIKQVMIAFPDQYGRLWSTQIHAERFCANSSEPFTF